METLDFLDLVWGKHSCYVDLPSKTNGHWIPYNVRWPDDRVLVRRRIESCLEDNEDLYFSTARFVSRGRRLGDMLPSNWLWADLDKVDPVFLDEDGVLPTLAWQSSQDRYQCLWRLNVRLEQTTHAKLNRALSYAIGADRGGWDSTQVLRPIGTKNHKYSPPHSVELLWYNPDIVYEPSAIVRAVRRMPDAPTPDSQRAAQHTADSAGVDLKSLPALAKRLLATPQDQVVVGERSAKLWKLECMLLEHGLSEQQVFDLVWPTAWNKHKEISSGERRLQAEIAKAATRVVVKQRDTVPDRRDRVDADASDSPRPEPEPDASDRQPRRSSPFVEYATFLSTPIETPRWLIKDIWSSSSHGIIGGEPKTSKSSLAMAMGLAVATGENFLGDPRFPVSRPGPVVMVQEENSPWVVQDRLRKLATLYGLIRPQDVEVSDAPAGSITDEVVRLDFPSEAPLYLLNNYGFDLEDEEDRDMLVSIVRDVGAEMVILDPLYLMVGDRNLNQGHEIASVMQWLMALRYNWDCAVVVVHHWAKSSESSRGRRPGQRLMGSGLLHGWVESAMYLESLGFEEDSGGGSGSEGGGGSGSGGCLSVKVTREFRNVAPRGELTVGWHMGEPGSLDMRVEVEDGSMRVGRVGDEALELLTGKTPPGGWTTTRLARELGVDRDLIQKIAVGNNWDLTPRKQGNGTSLIVSLPKEDS